MYLEEGNVDYDLLRDAVCESMETSKQTFQMNCPLKSCRSCVAAASYNAAPSIHAENGDRYQLGDQTQTFIKK